MRIAVLVKQVPSFEEMELGPDGRLVRTGIELEMNPYCRRAVAQAALLGEQFPGTEVTVFTLGPPVAEDSLREAIAWISDRNVAAEGVLITDPSFAGSDTLITAKALAAALRHEGPFDLVLTGRNSVDADTGQVPAQLAELLDLPFLLGVRHLTIEDGTVHARCEHDDGWLQADVQLPALLSCAERLCDPAKVDPEHRALVSANRIRTLTRADFDPAAPPGSASPTVVGPVRVLEVTRARTVAPHLPLAEQVRMTVAILHERGALRDDGPRTAERVGDARVDGASTMVVCEPARLHMARELLGEAQRLTGNVTAVVFDDTPERDLRSWGADEIVYVDGDNVEEDVANTVVEIAASAPPWALLTGSTAWGREVASRVAARLDAGLVGDAVELECDGGRLVAWKPAFGGQILAAITCTTPLQLATIRPGVLPHRPPRPVPDTGTSRRVAMRTLGRVRVLARTRDDELDILTEAHTVIGVGQGVGPDEYGALEPLRAVLGAELGATRKVTDQGWLPRARQIGITGRSIAPRLFVSIGASGKFNHTIGVRAAETVLAINPNVDAPIFEHADVGIVADWRDAAPLLVDALRDQLEAAG